jgi:hypothetical protein
MASFPSLLPGCVCSRIRLYSATDAEVPAQLVPDVKSLLEEIFSVLANFSDLEEQVGFTVRRKKKRPVSDRIRGIYRKDLEYLQKDCIALLEHVKEDKQTFWTMRQPSSVLQDTIFGMFDILLQLQQAELHAILVRRFSCVAVFLLTTIAGKVFSDQAVARQLHQVGLYRHLPEEELVNQCAKFRDAGRRYLAIALLLGGLGVLWFLPPDATPTVYVELSVHLGSG